MVQDGTGGKSWQVAWDDDGARDQDSNSGDHLEVTWTIGARCGIEVASGRPSCGSDGMASCLAPGLTSVVVLQH